MESIKYYSLNNILKKHAQYNVIFGKRSNGKTFACLEYGIKEFFKVYGPNAKPKELQLLKEDNTNNK